MRFLMLHHYVTNGRDSFRAMNGSVYFDAKGNRYFRADHMSQGYYPEDEMEKAAEQMENHPDCVGWDLQVFPDTRDLSDLVNKLCPVHPTEVYATQ